MTNRSKIYSTYIYVYETAKEQTNHVYRNKNVWSWWAEGCSSLVCIVVSGGGGNIEILFYEGLFGGPDCTDTCSFHF